MEVNAQFSQASHWIGKPDEVKPNLGFRVWAETKGECSEPKFFIDLS